MSVNSRSRDCRHPRAFTLVEMLIAMALTLILVYAIAEGFAYCGTLVKDGRAMIEMNNALRTATVRLKTDLELLTVPVVPWADDGSSHGYFCIYELGAKDWDINNNGFLDVTEDVDGDGNPDMQQFNISSLHGDSDDMICMTIRSPNEPFTGQAYDFVNGQPITITSPLAEVIWFTGFTETNGTAGWQADEPMFLYRRQMLIRPDLGQIGGNFPDYPSALTALREYWSIYGASVSASIRAEDNGSGMTVFRIRANTLLDLSRREHRFAHQCLPTNFPNAMLLNPRDAASLTAYTLQDDYVGEDRLLSNVISFDVRVFDPRAPLLGDGEFTDTNSDTSDDAVGTVQPGDPGWEAAVGLNNSNPVQYPIVGYGAFVDLYYGRPGYAPSLPMISAGPVYPPSAVFYSAPVAASQMGSIGVYDTWALSYERDGYNQNGGILDSGTDGLDNDGVNGVDDPGERETSPPYPAPLRGIQVRIRVIEPGTRQVRQATVGADFIQE
jgi:prepilin-type N-terminal cleavage/methylation domain-containing protein